MINLLPSNDKQNIRAARMNVLLVRFVIIQIFAVAFLAIIFVIFYIVLTQIRTSAESMSTLTQNNQAGSISQQYQSTINKLNSANTLLSSNISYSKTLVELGSLTPAGVVLDPLTLNPDLYDKVIELKGRAKDNSVVSQFSTNLEAAKNFSSEVKLKSTTNAGASTDEYPIEFLISLKINKPGAN